MTSPAHPADFRTIWEGKPVLRAVYRGWYERIAAACRPGRTLEVGGGSGNLKAFAPDVVSTDMFATGWLDAVCDAHRLPFSAESFDNIVMFDVLHHLERPARFFEEASRILRPGGRVVLLEPGITPVSRIFYGLFHHEPVDMAVDPLADGPLDPARDPYDSNQAIPTLLFGNRRRRRTFEQRFPALTVSATERLALIVYPLSGGFRSWSLVPAALVRSLTMLENALAPLLGWALSFRIQIVLEKRN
ncbi:MAG: methyltransferase domain-containing protein [Alphaproteobacteria bacterium]|nr:methyltransferase domain-containing protein [Alphaproteobacteria bacterium]